MQSIYPVLKYSDAPAAIDFLERAFGFQRHAVHEGDAGAIVHGELRFGDQVVLAPTDQDYGSRDFSARDPEGNIWSFGTYRPELG